MIVSLYFWGGVQRAEHCHGCLSCSQRRPLQTWLILCSAVNRTICLWAASELIPAKHHFLQDGEEMFLSGYKWASQQINRVPAPGSLSFCLCWTAWWQPCWISKGQEEVRGRVGVGEVPQSMNIHQKVSKHGNLQKSRASFLWGVVLLMFSLSRGSWWQQTSAAPSFCQLSWTDKRLCSVGRTRN